MNGRYGGGKAGPEHRFSFPAVDTDRWDEAHRGSDTKAQWQGEAGQVDMAVNSTMDGGRGKIMGATVNGSWPNNGFRS